MRGRSFLLDVPSARPIRTTGQAVLAATQAAADTDRKKCRLEWGSGCISIPSRGLVRFQVGVIEREIATSSMSTRPLQQAPSIQSHNILLKTTRHRIVIDGDSPAIGSVVLDYSAFTTSQQRISNIDEGFESHDARRPAKRPGRVRPSAEMSFWSAREVPSKG